MTSSPDHSTQRPLRVIVSGGGTGGHIFPAIAIADELGRLRPGTEFLFVGAEGKMEMEKVPQAGYEIVGLPIRGLDRTRKLRNLAFPFRLLASLWQSRRIVKDFRPDVVVGTGGYAGGPILFAAAQMGVPTLIQEPNAYAGLANKWVGRYVDKICVAFPGMERFFPADKLVLTGNPLRERMLNRARSRSRELENRVLTEGETHILLMGGSGGARSLNEAMASSTERIMARARVQWKWQCGGAYYEQYKDCATAQLPNVELTAFIDDMEQAYATADVVIGRAGSTTIGEIQFLGKPAILVPSPWVAEDHQTKNAEVLENADACLTLPDAEVKERLVETVFQLIDDAQTPTILARNARAMAQTGAVTRIAEAILQLIPSPKTTAA